MATFWRKAKIHSLGGDFAEVEVLDWRTDKNILVKYRDVICHAIYNPFDNCIYVDDLYGVVR